MLSQPVLPLIDTHCHIDLYADPQALVNEIEKARVFTIALTNTPSVFPFTENLVGKQKYLRPALGLHPELVRERSGELPLFEEYLPRTRYIGEIGLDYSGKNSESQRIQRHVFEHILDLCDSAGRKVLTLHSRAAADDLVAAIPSDFNGTIILHWYSGSLSALKVALAKGCYVSINLAMVNTAKGKRLLHEVPLDRLLTESDGPFIQRHGAPTKPTYTYEIVQGMANELALTESVIREAIYVNFKRLLG